MFKVNTLQTKTQLSERLDTCIIVLYFYYVFTVFLPRDARQSAVMPQ